MIESVWLCRAISMKSPPYTHGRDAIHCVRTEGDILIRWRGRHRHGRDSFVVSGVLQLPLVSNDLKALRRDAKHRDSRIHTPYYRTSDPDSRAIAD